MDEQQQEADETGRPGQKVEFHGTLGSCRTSSGQLPIGKIAPEMKEEMWTNRFLPWFFEPQWLI
jgi:hypothetical protein